MRIVHFFSIAGFQTADFFGEFQPAVQQRDDEIIDPVNLLAKLGQVRHQQVLQFVRQMG